jgi:hypothetical protein
VGGADGADGAGCVADACLVAGCGCVACAIAPASTPIDNQTKATTTTRISIGDSLQRANRF